jgi:hypothetical protein
MSEKGHSPTFLGFVVMSGLPSKADIACRLIAVCGGAIISLFVEESSLQYV